MDNVELRYPLTKHSLLIIAKIFLPGILLLLIIALYSFLTDFHFDVFSRDTIQLLDGKPYYGIISNIGIILWCATAAILLFSAMLSSKYKDHRQRSLFLFSGGILSLLLLSDDFFMIHDVVFPEYLNIDEKVVYFFYGLSVIIISYLYRKLILNSDYILLILSFVLLGTSAMTDMVLLIGLKLTYPFVVEDSLKFLGIISWFAYFTRTSYNCLRTIV